MTERFVEISRTAQGELLVELVERAAYCKDPDEVLDTVGPFKTSVELLDSPDVGELLRGVRL